MNNNVLYYTLGISAGIILLIIAICYLKYKGINTLGAVQKIKSFFTKAETYTEAAERLTEGKAKEILGSADVFEKLAIQGTTFAEQMLLSLQIKNDTDGSQRRKIAQDYIYAFLQEHGIEINDNIKTIVAGIVEKTVLSDKTIEQINSQIDKLVGEKVTALQNQITSLASQITSLTVEKQQSDAKITELTNKNIELNDKLTAVKSTVIQAAQQ
jgi:hypothetical protein